MSLSYPLKSESNAVMSKQTHVLPFSLKLHFTVKAVQQMGDNHHPRHSQLPEAAPQCCTALLSGVTPLSVANDTVALSTFGERETEKHRERERNVRAEINNT